MLLSFWLLLGSLIDIFKLNFCRWHWLPLEKFLKLHVASWVGLGIVQRLALLSHTVCWIPNDAMGPISYFWYFAYGFMHICVVSYFFALSLFLKRVVLKHFYRWLLVKTRLFAGPLLLVFLLYNHTVKLNVIRWAFMDIFFSSFWYLLKGSENKRTESGSVLHSQVYYYILWIIIKE